MIIKWLTGLIRNKKKKEKIKVEIEELKKAILEDPKFRDEILRELEYRTGRRDILKAGVLGLLGLSLGLGGSYAYNASVNTNTVREVASDYAGVKIPKPSTCIVAQDGTGDYDVSPREDASEVIQKAIDDVHRKGGGEVKIREGKYYLYNTIYIQEHIIFTGCGQNTLLILGENVSRSVIESADGKTYRQVIIKDLKIDGNKRYNHDGCGIYCRLWDSIIQNVVIQNMPRHGIDLRNKGLGNKNIVGTRDDNKIIACSIRNCGGVGIYASPVLKIIGCDIGHNNIAVCENAVRIHACNIYGATIWIENKEAISIMGNHITTDGRAKAGIKIFAKNGFNCRDVEIVGNDFRGSASNALIDIESQSNCLISNVIISGNIFNARNNRSSSRGIWIRGNGIIKNILITNNIFTGVYEKGVFVNKANNKSNINIKFENNIVD